MYVFLITLREGLEAALVIGLVVACLVRIGHARQARQVWSGALAALGVTVAVGAAVSFMAARLNWYGLHVFEGGTLVLAAGVLTLVTFWMRKQAGDMKADLQARVEASVRRGSLPALAVLSFVLLVREGIELVLFLQAGSVLATSPGALWSGVTGGLALAAVLGYMAYKGSGRLSLRAFFDWTGVVLLVFAAGMIANGLGEWHEISLVPPVVEVVWNTQAVLPDSSTLGRFLGTLIGYDATPSLVQVVAYFSYLIGVLLLYRRHATRPASHPPGNQAV